ncbi:MAG: cytochrome P450 [Acidimicrobiia bacterium]|nr:cytochrome P450 [Acidimicrobiia bacterium]
MELRTPVVDWATDFDHHDQRYAEAAPSIWAELRQRCPVAHTDRFHGAWMPVRYEDIAAVAYDTATFSSRSVVLNDRRPEEISFVSPPITSDPPQHTAHRRVLLPQFTPQKVEELAAFTRAGCERRLDTVLEGGRADAAVDYAQHIPVMVTARMLGLPDSDADQFRAWVNEILVEGPVDIEVGRRATYEVIDYFRDQVEDRRRRGGGDDLVAWVADAEIDGRPVEEKEQLGMLFLLLLAGIDTTWSTLGASLWHLAAHPGDQDRLRADPDLLVTAIEEFLRFYAPVSVSRVIARDAEIGGCPVGGGKRVALAFPAANRDPDVFPDADTLVLDRAENRHLAFGLGVHRCLGSNLARMVLREALGAWMARTPPFRLDDDAPVTWTGGQVRGPRAVPVVFDG